MARINSSGYVEQRGRNWWLIKHGSGKNTGCEILQYLLDMLGRK